MGDPIEGRDYQLIDDDPNVDVYQTCNIIRILRKPWKDIVVRIGTLKFSGPDESEDFIRAKFDFELVSAPRGVTENDLHTNRKFNQFLGSILEVILIEQLKVQEDNGYHSLRDSDIEIVEESGDVLT